MQEDKESIDKTKHLLGALLRMPPKPHSDMKLGRDKRVARIEEKDSSSSRNKRGRRPSKHG